MKSEISGRLTVIVLVALVATSHDTKALVDIILSVVH